MKLQGEFVLREIVGDTVVIPVGKTATDFNGMIILNSVSRVIWECLEKECCLDDIVKEILKRFEVEDEEATADIREFLEQIRTAGLLNEE